MRHGVDSEAIKTIGKMHPFPIVSLGIASLFPFQRGESEKPSTLAWDGLGVGTNNSAGKVRQDPLPASVSVL